MYLHGWCRRLRTVPAPGLVVPHRPPGHQCEYSLCLCRRGVEGGVQVSARQLWGTHLAVYVVCQSQRWETHQSSPGRNSEHIVTERLPPSPKRCVIERDSKGLRRWEGSYVAGSQKSWFKFKKTKVVFSKINGLKKKPQDWKAASSMSVTARWHMSVPQWYVTALGWHAIPYFPTVCVTSVCKFYASDIVSGWVFLSELVFY